MDDKTPKSLWILSLIYMTFTFAFGVFLSYLLVMLELVYGLTKDQSFNLFAAFNSLAFSLPVLGGFFCDKFGFRNGAMVGLLFSAMGMLTLLMPGFTFLILGLSIFLVGNAFCTPALWSLVGMLYHKQHKKRESGSTIFYLLFNIGFLLSAISAGFMLKYYGKPGLILYIIPLFFGFLLMLLLRKKIRTHNELISGKILVRGKSNLHSTMMIIIISITLVPICYFLLNFVMINSIIMWVIVALAFLYIIYLSIFIKDRQKSKHLVAYVCLCFIGFAYLIIFNSEFGLLPIFAQSSINLMIGSIQLPAGEITSLDAFYCIFLGLIYSTLWTRLEKKGKNPSFPTKFSLGLIFASIGYLILSLLIFTHLSSTFTVFWLLLVFLFFVSGELMILPIGIAMAGKLAPEGKEGLLMGVWNMVTGVSAVFVGFIASFTVSPKGSSLSVINTQYLKVFFTLGLCIFIVGLIAFILRGLIKRLL
ncbi:oligopeptide:H+ symporter [Thiotrichales bacterium 19X7-9]|nr:oligopeptide:H+ symporter [Thiotrichales bacterium 19X7-9]